MKKEKFREYQKLDTEQMNLEDSIDNQRNHQWKLRNEILKIGLKIGRDQKQLTLVRHQKRILLGREIVELEEKKEESS